MQSDSESGSGSDFEKWVKRGEMTCSLSLSLSHESESESESESGD